MADQPLGDRMKRYERQTRTELPKRTYTLVRVDGKAFHSYTRRLGRPMDLDLMLAMDTAAEALVAGMSGSAFAYVQSDEISVLLTDFASHGTEPWMGGVLQKVVSISASIATSAFNLERARIGADAGATFDSRAWTIADPNEVMNYFIWRQRDCVKNSITMAAQSVCSHRELEGLNSDQRQEAAWKRGLNWNEMPEGFKRGRVAYREEYAPADPGLEGVTRRRSAVRPAEHFTAEGGGWLVSRIPPLPTLPEPRGSL